MTHQPTLQISSTLGVRKPFPGDSDWRTTTQVSWKVRAGNHYGDLMEALTAAGTKALETGKAVRVYRIHWGYQDAYYITDGKVVKSIASSTSRRKWIVDNTFMGLSVL